jgi:hypothetical protein
VVLHQVRGSSNATTLLGHAAKQLRMSWQQQQAPVAAGAAEQQSAGMQQLQPRKLLLPLLMWMLHNLRQRQRQM